MKKRICCAVTILIIMIIFTACSIREFNDSIESTILNTTESGDTEKGTDYYKNPQAELPSETESISEAESSEYEQNSVSSSEIDDRVILINFGEEAILKGVGETFDAFVYYIEDGKEVVKGAEGVTFTLNSVKTYDNFYDAGVELNASITEPDGSLSEFTQREIEVSSFILVEFTALYTAPEGVASECVCDIEELQAVWIDRKMDSNYNYVFPPYMDWLNKPSTGDDDIADAEDNKYRVTLKDGEAYIFEVGIFADPKYIEDNNVYLMVNYVPSNYIEGYKHKYFELFPSDE